MSLNRALLVVWTSACFLLTAGLASAAEPANPTKLLAIGTAAPDFNLPGVDGKDYTLASFQESGIRSQGSGVRRYNQLSFSDVQRTPDSRLPTSDS